MYFLDLATQGVRGFSHNARVALTPGYVVLHPASGTEGVPLSALVLALLYPEGRGSDGALAAPGAKVGKAALTLLGNDVVTYRVVRELGGSGVLQWLNKTTQRFEVVTQDVAEANQFLRSPVGAPTRATFEQLFTIRATQFPSRNPKPVVKAAPVKKPALPPLPPSGAASADVAAAERKLRELSKELELSQEVEQLQAKQDEIASEMFALESVLKGADEMTRTVQEAEAAFHGAPTPESLGLPADILQRIEAYPEVVRKRDAALAKLPPEQEGEEAAPVDAPPATTPLYRDVRFIAAAGLGIASLAAGAFLQGWAKYVALLDIPFFGVAALFALQWIDELKSSQRVGRQGGRAAARRKKILDDFEAEAAPVRAALNALNVESEEEARNILGQRAVLKSRVEDARKQLSATKSGREIAAATQKQAELKARSDALAAKLQERAGGYVRESREVQREMQRVRESLEQARANPGPAADPAPALSLGGGFEDPTPALLSVAAEHAQSDPAALASQVRDRCGQYLAALSDRRFTAVELDARAGATLVDGNKRVRAADLLGRDIDLFSVALRLALVEKLSTGLRVPLLIEDLDALVEAARHAPLARMIKHLGTLTQVLHLTASQGFASGADVRANV
jgi:vacuolar-type H+-ATPase subunit D/Vma8